MDPDTFFHFILNFSVLFLSVCLFCLRRVRCGLAGSFVYDSFLECCCCDVRDVCDRRYSRSPGRLSGPSGLKYMG